MVLVECVAAIAIRVTAYGPRTSPGLSRQGAINVNDPSDAFRVNRQPRRMRSMNQSQECTPPDGLAVLSDPRKHAMPGYGCTRCTQMAWPVDTEPHARLHHGLS